MTKTASTPSGDPVWVQVRQAAEEAMAAWPDATRSKVAPQLRVRATGPVELEVYFGNQTLTTVVVPALDGPMPAPAKPFEVEPGAAR